ncbi:DoxX family protein [Halorubraceae archaeon YAN]|nr:DoxX family protein [Halorubraceae archaeon YAN]
MEEQEVNTVSRTSEKPSLLGRLLFGGMLAFTAINSFRNLDGQVAYAEAKGVKNAGQLVPFSSGMLLVGSIGVILWKVPKIAAGAIVAFLAAVTPTMHDFWNVDDGQKQNEMNHFIKNSALLGGALALLGRAFSTTKSE